MQAIEIKEMWVIYITLPSSVEKEMEVSRDQDVRDEILNIVVLLASNDNH